jgi:hypothetical protein
MSDEPTRTEGSSPARAGEAPRQLIRRAKQASRRKFPAEEKIRIVLEGVRAEVSMAGLCRQEGIHPTIYYRWLKDCASSVPVRVGCSHPLFCLVLPNHLQLKGMLSEVVPSELPPACLTRAEDAHCRSHPNSTIFAPLGSCPKRGNLVRRLRVPVCCLETGPLVFSRGRVAQAQGKNCAQFCAYH